MRFTIAAMLVLVIASTHLLYAEELEKGAVPFKAVGQVMTSSEVKEAPPYGPFKLLVGKEIEKIGQGTEV